MEQRHKDTLHLIERSPDRGDGWRVCSSVTWPLITEFPHQELIERNDETLAVRLTEVGRAVVKYA